MPLFICRADCKSKQARTFPSPYKSMIDTIGSVLIKYTATRPTPARDTIGK